MLVTEEVATWLRELQRSDPLSAKLVNAAIQVLAESGPMLGRPLVDRISGSRYHHLKELRPGSAGATEIRILFAFDPHRSAVLLVAGDKRGRWRAWYREAVPLAEALYAHHIQTRKATGDE